jgi:hypothetical protein
VAAAWLENGGPIEAAPMPGFGAAKPCDYDSDIYCPRGSRYRSVVVKRVFPRPHLIEQIAAKLPALAPLLRDRQISDRGHSGINRDSGLPISS